MNKTEYAYAIGNIRARESRLVDKGKLSRMIRETTIGGAVRELIGTDHEGKFKEQFIDNELDIYLEKHREEIIRIIDKLSKNPELTNILLLRSDFQNLKLIFKGFFQDEYNFEISEELFLKPSVYTRKDIEDFIKNRNVAKIPHPVCEAIGKVFSKWEDSKNPFIIDAILDNVYFSYSIKLLEKRKERFLEKMFIIKVDILNLLTFVRLKKMNKDIEVFKKFFLEGGKLEESIFIENFTQSWDEIKTILLNKDYSSVIDEKMWGDENIEWIPLLEKRCDDFLTKYIQQSKYVCFGIEPLFGYWWAKNIEIKNLRNVLMGKLNHFSQEDITSTLREAYN